VVLSPGRSTSKSRRLWHIFHQGKPAGRVFIVAQDPDSETQPDASITVELNEASRGRGIGTIAFLKASELSEFREVYATMRKSNVASRIAASRAGFQVIEDEPNKEVIMVWRRED